MQTSSTKTAAAATTVAEVYREWRDYDYCRSHCVASVRLEEQFHSARNG